MEQAYQVKCHLCGGAAEFAFAYARFSERDAYLGMIYRGVCRECLRTYIESIKQDRLARGEILLWPMILLPVGALFAPLSKTLAGEIAGYCLLCLAIVLPVGMRLIQHAEAKRVRRASEEENIRVYSELMCREDAQRTSKQTKLIYLKPVYAEAGAAQIARETGVDLAAAERIAKLSAAVCERTRE